MRKYKARNLESKINLIMTLFVVAIIAVIGSSITVAAVQNTAEPVLLKAEPIRTDARAVEVNHQSITDLNLHGGVASIMDSEVDEQLIEEIAATVNNINYIDGFEEPQYIRCTGYCDYGYTKSGEYVRDGIVAGKKEWLGKSCYIYEVNPDGSCGELIGIYEFLDTGYGIDGSLINGTSIDVWHSSEDKVWNWMGNYGDYVYIQIAE